jgi:hypothetical protein
MTRTPDLEQLLSDLRGSYQRNHWADEVEPRLARVLETLSDADWRDLLDAMPAEPPVVGTNLAKGLRYTVTDRSTDLLATLLRSNSTAVGLAAAQSLFDRQQRWIPGISIRAELERHASSADPDTRQQLEALIPRSLC